MLKVKEFGSKWILKERKFFTFSLHYYFSTISFIDFSWN